MKKLFFFLAIPMLCLVAGTKVAEAQILKGFGKKLEKKIEQRIENKADRQVDKALDKADKKSDESIQGVFSKPKAESKDSQVPKTTAVFEPVAARPDQAVVLLGENCSDFS